MVDRLTVAERVALFLADVAEVCQHHQLSLGHEDTHGAFTVEPYSVRNRAWLESAADHVDERLTKDAEDHG